MAENEKMEKAVKAESNKAEKAKKSDPSLIDRIARWVRELKSELKKVQWPSKKQTVNNTGVVIGCVAVVGLFIWVFDFAATGIINALINLVG